MKKKILILGGTGYIGSALFLYLKKKNYIVDTVDIEWFGNIVNPKNIRKDFASLEKKLLDQYDIVILLAAHSSVAMCEDNMLPSFKNNIQNFVFLLEKLTHQKLIYASSSGVYGSAGVRLMSEKEDRYVPTNYYDLTKKTIDYYALLSGVECYGLRFGTVNGWSPNLRTDLMINKMIEAAKKTKKIHIFNSHVSRAILGITDLCRVMGTIIEADDKRGIYNIGSFNKTVKEIASDVAEMLQGITIINMGEKNINKVYNFAIDTTKFEQTFGFTFHDSVRTLVESFIKEKKGIKGVREKKVFY
jgi:UDP-glucose 4-epimerase